MESLVREISVGGLGGGPRGWVQKNHGKKAAGGRSNMGKNPDTQGRSEKANLGKQWVWGLWDSKQEWMPSMKGEADAEKGEVKPILYKGGTDCRPRS